MIPVRLLFSPMKERPAFTATFLNMFVHVGRGLEGWRATKFSLHAVTTTNTVRERGSSKASTIYHQRSMFGFVFSADHGEQRSALTTPLLLGASEAVFRSNGQHQKWPRKVFGARLLQRRSVRLAGNERRQNNGAKNGCRGHKHATGRKTYPSIQLWKRSY